MLILHNQLRLNRKSKMKTSLAQIEKVANSSSLSHLFSYFIIKKEKCRLKKKYKSSYQYSIKIKNMELLNQK